jgi:hypothetical protein
MEVKVKGEPTTGASSLGWLLTSTRPICLQLQSNAELAMADLVPDLGLSPSHLIPLGVLASYLVIVVVLLKLALEAVDGGTSGPSPPEAARRNVRWRTTFKLIAAGSLLHTWTRA